MISMLRRFAFVFRLLFLVLACTMQTGHAEEAILNLTTDAPVPNASGIIPDRYFVVFSAKKHSATTFGHAYVTWGREDSRLHRSVQECYGIYPDEYAKKSSALLSAALKNPGIVLSKVKADIKDDCWSEQKEVQKEELRLIVEVDPDVYKTSFEVYEDWSKHVEDGTNGYHLISSNCISFVSEVAESIGLNVPNVLLGGATLPWNFMFELIEKNSPEMAEIIAAQDKAVAPWGAVRDKAVAAGGAARDKAVAAGGAVRDKAVAAGGAVRDKAVAAREIVDATLQLALPSMLDRTQGRVEQASVVVLVDSSGSMRDTDPINLRHSALKQAITRAKSSAHVALIDFDSATEVLQSFGEPLGAWGGRVRAGFLSAIDRIDSAGGTDIRGALSKAVEIGGDRRAEAILLSDGNDTSIGDDLGFLNGMVVHTIAFSEQANVELLSRLAVASGGIYEVVEDAEGLARALSRVFGWQDGREVFVVERNELREGEIREYQIVVEEGVKNLYFEASWRGSDVDLLVSGPGGLRLSTDSAVRSLTGVEGSNYDIVRVDNPQPGTWNVQLLGVDLPEGGEMVTLTASSDQARIQSRWEFNVPVPTVGERFSVDLSASGPVQWNSVSYAVTRPDGRVESDTDRLPGFLGWAVGAASVFEWIPNMPGVHDLRIVVNGNVRGGGAIQRTLDRTIRVAQRKAGWELDGDPLPFIRR